MLAEVRAQFEAFRATGLTLDHVNAHKHFHLHPSILSAILAVAAEFGVSHVRMPLESWAILSRIDGAPPGPAAAALNSWGRFQRARLRRAGIATPDQVFGLAWSGAVTYARLRGLIANLLVGVIEVYTHPAVSSGFAGAAAGYRYEEELAALISTELRRQIVAAGIASGGFADAARRREASGWPLASTVLNDSSQPLEGG